MKASELQTSRSGNGVASQEVHAMLDSTSPNKLVPSLFAASAIAPPSMLESQSRMNNPNSESGAESRAALDHASIDYQKLLHDVSSSIKNELVQVEKKIAVGLRVPEKRIQAMLDHVRELGGKRLRPCLTLLSAKACGGITDETIRLAAVVELVHTATLVHDDILDNAAQRRHRETLHQLFGDGASILVGDWLFTHAYGLANQGDSTLPGRWIANAAKEVCEGEIRQGGTIGDFSMTESEYLTILGEKTGALCAVSCKLGAWSAGGTADQIHRLEEYGRTLGIAFQVYDDWLDVWGDPTAAGKTLGTDLDHGKPTLPLLRALNYLRNNSRFSCLHGIGPSHSLTEIQKLELTEAIDQSDASEYTIQFARKLSRDACMLLEPMRIATATENGSVRDLQNLAIAAVSRIG